MTSKGWKDLASAKKRQQEDDIPKEWLINLPAEDVSDVSEVPISCGLLTPKDLEITEITDVNVLLQRLALGEWSSVEVTTAFYKRAIVAQQITNCLTEIFLERALARATEVDEYLKTNGKPIGPLHGLPISLKDQLSIEGIETTMGYVSWIGKVADRNAVLVDILLQAGAVPFVRTNVPQTLMWPETYNEIFGRTTNPHNRILTSGGSSGGEGALIALKGSPLGVGSDIGGSVRIPSSFCGIYGLRPSYHRIPYAGATNSMEGQDTIPSVFGPMSNSLNGIKTFMQAVIGASPWTRDPLAVRKKWDEEAYQLSEHGGGKQLCFAIMWDDGRTIPHPPIHRALDIAKAALVEAGHKVINWKPLKVAEVYETAGRIWQSGAHDDFQSVVSSSGEPVLSDLSPGITEHSVDPKEDVSAYDLWQLHRRLRTLRQEYLAAWNATAEHTGTGRPIDAIIAPTAPYPAPPHGKNRDAVYTAMWNALDYPALVIPVSKVNPSLDFKRLRQDFLSKSDKENYDLYDVDTFRNAPIGIQIVGRTLEEEAVIGMAEIVDAALIVYKNGHENGEL